MITALFLIFLVYYLFVIALLEGWRKAIKPHSIAMSKPPVTVLVPVRNESGSVIRLLESLSNQDYPVDKMQVLVIDDHSEDHTVNVITEWINSTDKRFTILQLPKEEKGKKAAITFGIAHARGELILTTDGDCVMGKQWLAAMAGSFLPSTQLMIGPVRLDETGGWPASVRAMEFASLIGTGAATQALGFPVLCNGANLAYRKNAFILVGGYRGNEAIASGDDEFLLKKISKAFSNGIQFNFMPESIVTAQGVTSFQEFIFQRVRWASKWKRQGMGPSAAIALLIFLVHVAVLVASVFTFTGKFSGEDIALLVLMKFLIEGIFIYRVCRFLKTPFNPLSFMIVFIVYPVYAVFFGLTANFLHVRWKGRSI